MLTKSFQTFYVGCMETALPPKRNKYKTNFRNSYQLRQRDRRFKFGEKDENDYAQLSLQVRDRSSLEYNGKM